jgi:hypothetical protein
LADQFIFGVAPIDYSPVLLLMPFGFHLTMDTLPSGTTSGGSRSALAVSSFRLRARLGFSIPSSLPAREALPPRSDMALLIRAPEGLEPSRSNALLSAHYGPLRLPPGPPPRLCLPARRWSLALPSWRASQAPQLIFPRALSPTTPEGPAGAFACCYPTGIFRLHPARKTGRLQLANEAESGSLALRLAYSPHEFSPAPLLEFALAWLHAEQAITW